MRQLLLIIGLLIYFNATGQIIVKGIVFDIEGNPLPGVNVLELRGGENGTITNIEGQFSLSCYHQVPTLYFMYFRYETNVVIVDSTYFVSLEMEQKDRQYYKRYEGKKVGKLFEGISSNIKSQYYIEDSPGNLVGIELKLKDSTTIKIYFEKLKHVNQADKNRSWDWEKIKKERIEMINHFI